MFDHSSAISEAAQTNGAASDVVSELLAGMRLRGLDYQRLQITPPFGVSYGEDPAKAQFHFIAQGSVYLYGPDKALYHLGPGDAVLLPRGGTHALVSQLDVECRLIAQLPGSVICEAVKDIVVCCPDMRQEDRVVVFSGAMAFELGSMNSLVSLMPAVLHASTLLERNPEILPILEAMERETRTARAGFAGILTHLAEVVSASIVRGWVESGCGDAGGWIGALRDPRLARVIAAVHRDPGRDWTVENMAAQMGSSRSVFAERFQAVTGITPLRYVTELRMRMAMQWMVRDRLSIELVAERLGYGSQAAFSRAFKRVTGQSPGAVRAGREIEKAVTKTGKQLQAAGNKVRKAYK
ncbi:helix-turn-helix domain-containing protein [Pusillimonas sp. TS35]|uniref:AraC family transcriptional regulator n=1 Tax=Paracandidimonas lactea TaxID=2895524 RepID=UPI001368B618|nr:AraC family transcriptional regulator [Paracandidimonas lactea]MYN14237.1 helix-turn-helix domain-containing protein [Pusillimonas sp. TS35]